MGVFLVLNACSLVKDLNTSSISGFFDTVDEKKKYKYTQFIYINNTKSAVQESNVIFSPADGSTTLLFNFQGNVYMPPVVTQCDHLSMKSCLQQMFLSRVWQSNYRSCAIYHWSTVNKNREILNLKLNTGVCPEGGREVALVTSEIWVANPSTAWLAICSVIDVTLVQNISSTSIFEHAVQFVFDDLNK